MMRQPSSNTAPEMALRRALHARGARYRIHASVVPGTRRTVDIAFLGPKVAVFVDGCFWHGCTACKPAAKANAAWWAAKIAGNRLRDADTDSRLREAGWAVMRIWEHAVAEEAALDVLQVVRDGAFRPRTTVAGKETQ